MIFSLAELSEYIYILYFVLFKITSVNSIFIQRYFWPNPIYFPEVREPRISSILKSISIANVQTTAIGKVVSQAPFSLCAPNARGRQRKILCFTSRTNIVQFSTTYFFLFFFSFFFFL